MKVLPFEIPKSSNRALHYQVDIGPSFYGRLHRHEEIQVSLIIKGKGDLFVADSIHSFESGELFVFGSNTPHLFRSIEDAEGVHMITIFFTIDSFGKGFFDVDELQKIKSLIQISSVAIRIKESPVELIEMFTSFESFNPLKRVTSFLNMLGSLSEMEFEQLSSFKSDKITALEGERMGNVMDYAMNNYTEKVKLDDVAKIAHMTPNAFCRYFKLRTTKSFFQFITELRMAHAQRLLRQTDKTVLEIAYATGFKNISHFNRKFLQIYGCSPTKYRKASCN